MCTEKNPSFVIELAFYVMMLIDYMMMTVGFLPIL